MFYFYPNFSIFNFKNKNEIQQVFSGAATDMWIQILFYKPNEGWKSWTFVILLWNEYVLELKYVEGFLFQVMGALR